MSKTAARLRDPKEHDAVIGEFLVMDEEQARSRVVVSQVRHVFARETPSVDGQPVYEM
jgi:hypothetical protein